MGRKVINYILTGLGIIIFALSLTVYYQYRELWIARNFSDVDAAFQTQIKTLGLFEVEKEVKRKGFPFPQIRAEVKVKVPLSFSLDDLLKGIKERFSPPEFEVIRLEEENGREFYKIHLDIGKNKTLTHRITFWLKKAKIALLIDDFGYTDNGKLIKIFFEEINVPFTISIIPGTPFVREVAEKAHRKGKQILVHLPMQPAGEFKNSYRWIILKGMSKEKIRKTVKEAVESIPYAEGLNNHMGSLATTKKEIMEPLLQVLKEKKMFFVDSRTSPFSVGYSLARKMGVKSTFNCVFLDNKKEETYIEGQFKKLILEATEKGWAVGLAHSDIRTAFALKKIIEKCDRRKIEFVLCSEVLK